MSARHALLMSVGSLATAVLGLATNSGQLALFGFFAFVFCCVVGGLLFVVERDARRRDPSSVPESGEGS